MGNGPSISLLKGTQDDITISYQMIIVMYIVRCKSFKLIMYYILQ